MDRKSENSVRFNFAKWRVNTGNEFVRVIFDIGTLIPRSPVIDGKRQEVLG
jgi:hypothetical protein